jgi:pSer/pThr/pTyr-binding forkhead associated (FHA) protein
MLVKDEPGSETTMSYTPEEAEEGGLLTLEELGAEGPALVVRSGGGRAGEHFVPQGERTTIGRSPDCDIFLDDVTVSRKHAVLVRRDDAYYIEDQGSLNGTFLNRRRIESGRLENGDELQIGKYKLSFLEK